jgi:hypothetical protein
MPFNIYILVRCLSLHGEEYFLREFQNKIRIFGPEGGGIRGW